MNINPIKFALASAASFGIVWIACSLLVHLFPGMMLDLTSHMLHIDMHTHGWQISPQGALIGLIAWAALAGLVGWLFAFGYKLLISPSN